MTYQAAINRALSNNMVASEYYTEYKRFMDEGNEARATECLHKSLMYQGAEQAWHEVAWELDPRF